MFLAGRPKRQPLVFLAPLIIFATWPPSLAPAQLRATNSWNDPRLERQVLLRLGRTPLADVLAALAKQTGVTIKARGDLADEPAIVFATDQPASEVMRQLAGLFGYRWARSGDPGKRRYELFQDDQAREAEAALRQADFLKAIAHGEERRRQERPSDPALNALQESAGQLLARLTPADWQALHAGKVIRFAPQDGSGRRPLPAEIAAALIATVTTNEGYLNRPTLLQGPLVQQGVAVWSDRWFVLGGLWVNLRVDATFDEIGPAGVPLRTPSTVGLLRGGPLPSPPAAPAAPADPAESARRWAADPILGRVDSFPPAVATLASHEHANLDKKGPWLCDLLPLMAEAYGCNLVADAYQVQRPLQQVPRVGEVLPLHATLDAIARPCAIWSRHGSFVQVRSRLWHWERLYDIPDRVLQDWNVRLRERRRLELEDAAALVNDLRAEQLERLLPLLADAGTFLEPQVFRFGAPGKGERELLGLYGSLGGEQRRALRAGVPLPMDRLPPAAGRWLAAALDRMGRYSADGLDENDSRGGILTLRIEEMERTTGGEAGQTRRDAPPGFSRGGQVLQRLVFTYRHRSGTSTPISIRLPWAYTAEMTTQGGR